MDAVYSPQAEHYPQGGATEKVQQIKSTTSKHADSEGVELKVLHAVYSSSPSAREGSLAPPATVDTSTLWLARAIYSETRRPEEQELVAWVVRNRVETHYRGQRTYKDVVLDPYQFSAFNSGRPKRSFYMNLGPEADLPGRQEALWHEALWIAKYVRHAAPTRRPFPIETRHFYSEQSMKKERRPYWADQKKFVSPRGNFEVSKERFRFYDGIS